MNDTFWWSSLKFQQIILQNVLLNLRYLILQSWNSREISAEFLRLNHLQIVECWLFSRIYYWICDVWILQLEILQWFRNAFTKKKQHNLNLYRIIPWISKLCIRLLIILGSILQLCFVNLWFYVLEILQKFWVILRWDSTVS